MTFYFFWSQSFGFFTQLFPCMVLCFYAFGKERYRIGWKKCRIFLGLFGGISALAFPLLLCLVKHAGGTNDAFTANLYMLIVILLFVSAFIWIVQDRGIKKLLTINMVVFYAATQYMLANSIRPFVTDLSQGTQYAYDWRQLLIYVLSTVVFFPIMLHLFSHSMKDYLEEMDPSNLNVEVRMIIALTLFYFFIAFSYTSMVPLPDKAFYLFFCPLYILTAVVLLNLYYLIFRESVRRKRESELEKNEKIQEIQYQTIQKEVEKAAYIRHDARHHYRLLYDMAMTGDTEGMQQYLTQLLDQVSWIEKKNFCKNRIVNGLLQYYYSMAVERGIMVNATVNMGEIDIASVDLSTIIGNTLENAIFACEQVEDNKNISVKLGIIGGSFAMIVENSCKGVKLTKEYEHKTAGQKEEPFFMPANAFVSQKNESGYGLQSIAVAARHYDGIAEFAYIQKQNRFVTRVRMNTQKSEAKKGKEKRRENK